MQDRPTFGADRPVSTQWQHRRRSGVSQLLALAVALSILVVGVGGVSPTVANAATPAFVQVRANEVVSGTSNAVAFSSANTAGNLIAAYVIWSNVGGVSLADSRGNTYTAATARTTWGNSWSAQVFYAKSIAGGANTVTATFGTAISSFGIVYLHEYSGLNKVNPVDVTASAIGSSAAMSSGAVSTTNASDLLFGAGASMNAVTAAGTGFTTRSSAFDNRTEDRVVTSTGSYAATATQNSNAWVMQLVAFRADPGTSDSTPPTVALTAPANGATVSGSVNVTANANDNVAVASVQFLLDGNALGASDTTSPYSVTWDTTTATNGTHTLTARATDTTGNATTSAAVTVTVTNTDSTPPTVSITAPANGATVSGTVNVTANANDNVAVASVQFLLDNNALGASDTTSPYSVTWDTTIATTGTHTLTARATDTSGNTTTSATVNITVTTPVISAGPVAEYQFNEGTGTTAADASGDSLNGTLVNGPTWAAGKYGSAVNFDGDNDYVDLGNPAALQMTGSVTISGWINSASLPSGDSAIVSTKSTDNTGYQLDTTIDTGPRTVGFKLTSSTGADMIRYGATALQVNTWYYVTGVYNATSQTMDVYLNGVLDDGALLGTITSSQKNSTTNVNIGRRAGTLDSFNGLIDEVRIYGRALSAAEVQTDLNTPISVGWTTFFQGLGRTGFNSSENSLTATSAASLHLAWKTSDSGQPERGVFSQPIVANGTVYWGSFDGYERATDRSGHPLWQTFIGHTNDPTCDDPPSAGVVSTATFRSDVPVAGATSVLYVGGGDTKVYALNAATGAVLWSQSVGANPDHFIWSSPAVFGNSVYIGVSSFGDCPLVQGQLVQLDRVTGAVQNTFNTVPNGCIGAGVWGSPTIDAAAGTIYFTTGNDGACASAEPLAPAIVEVKASDLSLVGSWQVPPAEQGDDSDFGSTPTLFNGVIGGQSRSLVGAINKNGVFYAFTRDALGSGPVWRTRIAVGGGDPNFGTADVSVAAYDGSTLYVGGGNTTIGSQSCSGTVNALNPSTGAFAWRHCLTDGGWVLGGVTAAGGIVTAGEGNNVAVFSAATGASLFTFTGTGPFFGTPSIANGTLYAGDMAGNLYALTT
jgi:outer membrane protein assembly factor BamB